MDSRAGGALYHEVTVHARIARVYDGLRRAEHEVRVEAEVPRGDGGGARVVGLHRADGDHAVGVSREGVGEEELELAHLVAAELRAR